MEFQKMYSTHISEVRQHYNIKDNEIREDVRILQEWIKQVPHLPQQIREDEDWLERILLRNKFRLEVTKQKIESYCTLRGKYKFLLEYYPSIVPSKEACFPVALPKLTSKLQRVWVLTQVWDEDLFEFERAIALVLSTIELFLKIDYCVENLVIMDFSNTSIKYLSKFSLNLFRIFLELVLNAYFGRVCGIHLINAPYFMNQIINLTKPLVPEKIAKRVFIHDNLESLYTHVPKKLLPSDYAGSEKSLKEFLSDWDAIFQLNQKYFEDSIKLVSIEDLRVLKTTDDFGIAGTFKKLNID